MPAKPIILGADIKMKLLEGYASKLLDAALRRERLASLEQIDAVPIIDLEPEIKARDITNQHEMCQIRRPRHNTAPKAPRVFRSSVRPKKNDAPGPSIPRPRRCVFLDIPEYAGRESSRRVSAGEDRFCAHFSGSRGSR